MRQLGVYCCLVLLVGCAKAKEQPAPDTTAAAAPAPPAPAPISLADVAGKWSARVMPADKDTTLLSYDFVATGDSSGWTFNFPNRKPVPMRIVAVAGDSIVGEAGPYESALRKGVQVTTHSVLRLQDGKLVGTVVAHYAKSADSVRYLRLEATRAP